MDLAELQELAERENWDDGVECPACGYMDFVGDSVLGAMGNLLNHRCSGCGWQWSETIEDTE